MKVEGGGGSGEGRGVLVKHTGSAREGLDVLSQSSALTLHSAPFPHKTEKSLARQVNMLTARTL